MLSWAVLCHVVSTGVLHGFVQGSHRALAALVSYTSCPVLDRTVLRPQVSYRGSTEERSDLLRFYNEFGGSNKCCAVLGLQASFRGYSEAYMELRPSLCHAML